MASLYRGLPGPSDTLGDTSAQCSAPLRWLLKHLDNPYPSASVKHSLCKQSGLSLKAIGEWLSQTRRRIGWTTISKKHFKGDRQLTRDCVNRVLFEPSGTLHYTPEVVRDVENMRLAANRLYSKKFDRSRLTMLTDSCSTKTPCLEGGDVPSSVLPLKPWAVSFPDANSAPNSYSNTVGLSSEPQLARNNAKRKRSLDTCTIESDSLQIDTAERSRPVKRLRYVIPHDDLSCYPDFIAETSSRLTRGPSLTPHQCLPFSPVNRRRSLSLQLYWLVMMNLSETVHVSGVKSSRITL